jgi:hypothetical protein
MNINSVAHEIIVNMDQGSYTEISAAHIKTLRTEGLVQ